MLKKLLNKSKLYPYAVILIIAFVLVFIWFRDGYILGTAEGVLPFYNVSRFKDVVSFAWSEAPGLGNMNGISTAYSLTYITLAYLQNIGLPGFIIEALVFYFLLISSGISIYLLTKELFPKINWRFNLLSVFFYWFNFISLVNVWNRALYPFIFFWSLLPLVAFLFIRGLKSKNYIYIFLIGISTTIFSLGLGTPIFNILLNLLFIYITLFWILTTKNSQGKKFTTKFFVFTLLYFLLINSWWISQAYSYISTGSFNVDKTNFFDSTINLTTLTSLSKILGDITNVIIFKQAAFFNYPYIPWATMFNNPLLVIIEFSVSAIILLQLVRDKKNSSTLFLGILFISSIFLAKGNNPPIGGIFEALFIKFTLFQAFRDPFEKFGFLLVLAAAPLYAIGLQDLTSKLKPFYQKVIYYFYLFILLFVFGQPFFTSLVFTNLFPPNNDYSVGYKVKVPKYYEDANKWLESHENNFRFIGLPFKDEGITYKWEKGYQGVEPATTLFSIPNIYKTTVPYYGNVLDNLEENLVQDKNFTKIADRLNLRFLMIRSDIDFRERNIRDPKILAELLDRDMSRGILKHAAVFDQLDFWEFPSWTDKTIYPVNSLAYVYPTVSIADVLLDEIDSKTSLYNGVEIPNLEFKTKLEIVHPTKDKQLSQDEENIYQFNLKKGGSYEVLLKNASSSATVVLDNQNFSQYTFRADKNLSFGKVHLEAGDHRINIPILKTNNLVNLPSELYLSSEKNKELARFKIENFTPFSRYLITLEYLIKSDAEIKISLEQNVDSIKEGKVAARYIRKLPLNKIESIFVDFFEPDPSASEAWVVLSTESDQAQIILKNIFVNRLVEPQPVLIKENPKVNIHLPQVTYTKQNPSKYSVRIKGAGDSFILVLSELFNNGWEAIFDDGTLAKNHFLANAYANGWLIEKKGDFNLTLEFAPQRLLDKGKIISAMSFVGGLIFIGVIIVKNKFK